MYISLGSLSHYNIPEKVQTVKIEICSVFTHGSSQDYNFKEILNELDFVN